VSWNAQLSFGAGANALDVESFADWLRRTPSLSGVANIRVDSGPGVTTMGAGDVIIVVAATVSALTSIVPAYAAWRASRASTPQITVTIAGYEPVTLVHGTAEEVGNLIAKMSADDNGESGRP
jgi:hypothetical protein